MSFDPAKPYNDLPPLPPSRDIETKAILKGCVSAGRALATLRQAAALIPNQDVLINTIPLREAKDSSEIENIVTTNDKLFRYASVDSEKADDATKETLRYRTALLSGYREIQARPLTTNVAVSICRAIKNVDLDVRRVPGTVLLNNKTGHTIYTPPEGEDVLRRMLANWEKFIHEAADVDPLIRMAVRTLPVRGHSSVLRRQRQNGARDQYPLPDRAGSSRPADLVFEPIHQRESQRLLPPAARCHDKAGLGTVDTLHAVRRGKDVAMDDRQDQGDQVPHGGDRSPCQRDDAEYLQSRADRAGVHTTLLQDRQSRGGRPRQQEYRSQVPQGAGR